MDKKNRILVLCAVILFLWFVGSASATTWSVDGSGGANFTRIQDAIDNSSDGDTILVYPGVYYENVVVAKSVTLKGKGHPVVDAGGSGSSITLTADGVTLERFKVTNAERSYVTLVEVEYGAGIKVISSNNIITGNTASNNECGIYLYLSCNNTITGNNVSNNECDIALISSGNNNTITGNTFANGGLIVYESNQNTVENNTVNGKPLVYLEDVSNYKVEDAGQVVLVNCSNIIVKNQDLSNVTIGIALWKTEDSTISNNKVCNNRMFGIHLFYSGNNTITGNRASNNECGISLSSSGNNTITGNNVSNNDNGISLASSSNNTITGNNISNNDNGISLVSSSNNTITGNTVRNNDIYLYLYNSINNVFYCNNFIINSTDNFSEYAGAIEEAVKKAIEVIMGERKEDVNEEIGKEVGKTKEQPKNPVNSASPHTWNSTKEIRYIYNGTTHEGYLGNYWSDYKEKYPAAEEIDTTGIWDMPYRIDEAKDNYPLMERFENYINP